MPAQLVPLRRTSPTSTAVREGKVPAGRRLRHLLGDAGLEGTAESIPGLVQAGTACLGPDGREVGFLLAGTQAGHALPLPRTYLLPTEIGSLAGRFPYSLPKTRVVCCSMSVHCSPPCVVEITKWSTNDGFGLAVKALALVVLHQEVGTVAPVCWRLISHDTQVAPQPHRSSC